MRRIPLIILLGLATLGLARADELARTISVAGQGKVSAPPDIVFIRTGVTTESAEAQTALAENNAAMNRVLALLQRLGVAEYDINTTNFNVAPVTKRNKLDSDAVFVGYRVGNQLRVRLTDVAQLGEILDALVAAGSNRVAGIEFALDDPGIALDDHDREQSGCRRPTKKFRGTRKR